MPDPHITITDQDTVVYYIVGATPDDTFTVPFEFFSEEDDIRVFVDDTEQLSGFTIVGNTGTDAGFNGGTCTLDTPVSDVLVTLMRDLPEERTTDFPLSGPFNIRQLNTELDKIIALIQELKAFDGRTFHLAVTDANGVDTELPAPLANALIQWNSDGTALENIVIAGLETAVADAQAAAADAANSASNAASSASAAANSAAAAAASASTVTEGIRNVHTFVASGGETSVTPGFDVEQGLFDVFLNGHLLTPGVDYTDADGSSVGGFVAFSANDEVTINSYGTFVLAEEGALLAVNDLSDLNDVPTARSNLGLGGAALLAESGVLKFDGDLSELDDLPASRTNLGLGNLATQDAGDGLVNSGSDLDINTNGLPAITPETTDEVLIYDISAGIHKKSTVADLANAGGGSFVKLSTVTAVSQAEVTFTSLITSAYDEYLVRIIGVIPATNLQKLQIQVSTDNGSTYKTTSYHTRRQFPSNIHPETGHAVSVDNPITTGSQTAIDTGLDCGNGTGESGNFWIRFTPNVASVYKQFHAVSSNFRSGQIYHNEASGCWTGGTAAVNAIKFKFASGNIQSGKFILYGVK